ncbi:MAG: hypothetical protein ACXWTX_05650 [Gallionella sp.]
MLHKKIKLSVLALLVFIYAAPIYAATVPCPKAGYTLGFFNGVWNTEFEARSSMDALKAISPQALNGLAVTPRLFYNQTGCNTLGATCLQDLAETFIQRANELDQSGALAKDFILFWEITTGDSSYSSKLSGFLPNLASIFSSLYATVNTKLLGLTSLVLSSPPTAAIMAANNAALDQLAAEGQHFMLVAHSQGNLFMNQAYDHILPVVSANGIQAIHIAPASLTLRGEYVLSSMDSVINGLSLLGGIQPSNYVLPQNPDDTSGHTLLGTYLNPTLAGTFQGIVKTPKQVVTDLISTAMFKLSVPLDPVCNACSALPAPMTLAQFNLIAPGMSYGQVNSILGCAGKISSPTGLMPESYMWSRIVMPSVQMVVGTFYGKKFDPTLGSVKSQSGLF